MPDHKMPVFFSIIIPTYNRAALLKITLQSLLAQHYRDFEILVIDDGGNDNTKEMVEAFADERVSYYWKVNAERGAARNYGAALAKGNYLNFFDSDDLAYHNHLQTAATYFQENPDSVILHNSYDWKYPNLKKCRSSVVISGRLNNRVFRGNILSPNGVFVRKAEFDLIKFSEDRALSGTEDWLLWLQLGCRYPIWGLPVITSAMIQHDTRSMTTASGASTLLRTHALSKNMKDDKILLQSKNLYNLAMAEMYYLSALYYSIGRHKKQALQYARKAIGLSPAIINNRRTLAIIKYLLKP